MELTTSWKEEGIEIGRREGRREGQQEGLRRERQLVLRLLRRRFGRLTPEIESAVEALPVDRIEDLGEASVDFTSVADLENWFSPG
jgi:predicted transposase YdaD